MLPRSGEQQRRQVELFFRWFRQNLNIKTSLGATRNVVATQVFVALCLYLLLPLLKFQARLAPQKPSANSASVAGRSVHPSTHS